MKCQKCGVELALGAAFCHECGAKVIQKKRFCYECGSELEESAKFCSTCGTKVTFKELGVEKVDTSKFTMKNEEFKETPISKETERQEIFSLRGDVQKNLKESGKTIRPKLFEDNIKSKGIVKNKKSGLKYLALAIAILLGVLNITSRLLKSQEPISTRTNRDNAVQTAKVETPRYTIDYIDAESFEKDLNDGKKVQGKVVQFIVLEYKPDTSWGVNCWAGEHLNFISQEALDVVKGQTIVGRVTEEPTSHLSSWIVPYEILSISKEIVEVVEEEGELSHEQRNGFNSFTNEVYSLGGYTIEIPDYWIYNTSISDGFQRYAETGGKVAILQVTCSAETDNNYDVTFDGLMADNENMIKTIEKTAFKTVTDYEIIDTGSVKGILYKGTLEAEGIGGTGYWFVFPSEEDRCWCTIICSNSANTAYLYDEDFMKMISSIRKVEAKTAGSESTKEQIAPKSKSVEVADVKRNPAVILPDSNTKLGKDFDMKGTNTVYYVNVDGQKNKPILKKWGSATVTDGVAEYLNYLKDQGCNITITRYETKTPYSGFTVYETYFNVENENITWDMYLCIQDEKYVEYELDINLS